MNAKKVTYDVPPIAADSRVEFRELVISREAGRDPLLGCQEVKTFVEVDDDTLFAIDAIEKTSSLAEANKLIEAEYGEDFDLVDLTEYLGERGFIRAVDGVEVTSDSDRHSKTHFANVPAAAVRWIHHPALLLSVPILFAAAIFAVKADPTVMPRYYNLFAFENNAAVIVVTFVVLMANTYIHELAHLFMARSFDVASNIRFSNRFHILVMETDVTNAWVLPPKRRALIFLAGMGYNILLWSLCVLLSAVTLWGMLPIPQGAVKWLLYFGFINMIPIMFQFMLWIRTDLYFTLLTLTGERNLMQDSRNYMKYALRRVTLWARRQFDAQCTNCSRKLHAEDPWCHRCGTKRKLDDPNLHNFNHRSRYLYLGYGVLLLVMMPWMMYRIVTAVVFFQFTLLKSSAFRAMAAYATGDVASLIGDVLVVIVTGLQITMITYFMGPRILGLALKVVLGIGRLAAKLGRAVDRVARRRREDYLATTARTAAVVAAIGIVLATLPGAISTAEAAEATETPEVDVDCTAPATLAALEGVAQQAPATTTCTTTDHR